MQQLERMSHYANLLYQIQGCFYQFTFVDSEKEITSDFATITFILVEKSRASFVEPCHFEPCTKRILFE